MKFLKYFFAGVVAFAVLDACTHEDPIDTDSEHDDAYYAEQASIGSSDSAFSASEAGGTILFGASGGQVVVNVDCGTEWIVENQATDLFGTSANLQTGTLTVTASQITLTEARSADIVLKTANMGIAFCTITVTQEAYNTPGLTLSSTECRIPAAGDLTAEIEVESTIGDWEVEEVSVDWLSAQKTETGLSFTANENADTEERSVEVVITCSDGLNSDSATIRVTQDAKAYVTSSRESILLYEAGDAATFSVESNYDWDFSYDSTTGWLTVERNDANLTVTVTKDNDSDDSRECVVTLTAGDGAANVAETSVTVTEAGATPDALILVYTTTAAGTEITLPLSGTVNCSVDWGDGSEPDSVTSSAPTHSYANAGEYKVRINGTVTALSSESIDKTVSALLTEVSQWGATGLTSMNHAFYRCSTMQSIPAETGDALADVKSFEYAFSECKALDSIPADLFAKCSGLTSFDHTFYYCKMTSVSEDLFATCTDATTFDYVFGYCSSLASIPENIFANNTKATSFSRTFFYCQALTSVPEGLFANCPDVNSFLGVFYYCTKLTSIPEGIFAKNTKVTTFDYAFTNCAITEVPAGLFANNPEVTSFQYTFYMSSITTLPEGLFDNNTKVESFYWLCYRCSNLKSVPASLFAKCPEVTDFSNVFYSCTNLEEIPEGLFANNKKVKTFQNAFHYCFKITSLPDGLFSGCSEVTSFEQTFSQCTTLVSIPAHLFAGCEKVETFKETFRDCPIQSIDDDIFADCTAAENFNLTFYLCSKLTSIPTDLFSKCLKASVFTETFESCVSLTGESPYTELNGVKVHLYERMNDEYKGYFETSSIGGKYCFYGCYGLTDLDAIKAAGWYN